MNLILTLLFLSAVSAYIVYRIDGLERRLKAGNGIDPNHMDSRSAARPTVHHTLGPTHSVMAVLPSLGDGGTTVVRRGVDPGQAPNHAVSESMDAPRPNRFVEQARRAVESRLADAGFGVDDLASQLGLSPRQVQRRLRESTGLSPNAFIRGIRLQEAARLLLHTESPVAAIAQGTGFGSASHFSKCFRDFFGDTPMSYARKWTPRSLHSNGNELLRAVDRSPEAHAPIGRAHPRAIELRSVRPERGRSLNVGEFRTSAS